MFGAHDPAEIRPFEICSIRPPTENASLTFRLTRNCHWNRCAFCPVYKLGARYSRRTIDEVREDVRRAAALDDYMFSEGIGNPVFSTADFDRAAGLAGKIRKARWEAGSFDEPAPEYDDRGDLDPRMRWFLSWFNSTPGVEECMRHMINWRIDGARTCFLGDADSLTLKPDFVEQAIGAVKTAFPSISRFTVYGRTSSAARIRTPRDLRRFAAAGVDRVHFGLESGSDAVLAAVNKGTTFSDHVEGCHKIRDAGISCSIYVMPGLGGEALSVEHALETARAISAIGPDYVRLRTLEVFPMTGLDRARERGEFTEASEETVVREIRLMLENIGCATTIVSDSATNLLEVNGVLPADRDAMFRGIDDYLALGPREKIEFSFWSRLRSFMGQYGDLSPEIIEAITPVITGSEIDTSRAEDSYLLKTIQFIRSRLMP